jgi:hypothetical protein
MAGLSVSGWKFLIINRWRAWVCGCSPAGIGGSNLAPDMDVCLLWVLCAVRLRSLRRADRSSRGVLPSVVCLKWMWSWSLVRGDRDPNTGRSASGGGGGLCSDDRVFGCVFLTQWLVQKSWISFSDLGICLDHKGYIGYTRLWGFGGAEYVDGRLLIFICSRCGLRTVLMTGDWFLSIVSYESHRNPHKRHISCVSS